MTFGSLFSGIGGRGRRAMRNISFSPRRIKLRTLMVLIAVVALILTFVRVLEYERSLHLCIAGRAVAAYYPSGFIDYSPFARQFNGPTVIVWQLHDHPRSCWKPVYYLAQLDCPVIVILDRTGVRIGPPPLVPNSSSGSANESLNSTE